MYFLKKLKMMGPASSYESRVFARTFLHASKGR
jgi:hypothetical protein